MASSSGAGGYKTQICRFWLSRTCIYGPNCRYSHGIEEQIRHLFPNKSYATTGSAEAATAASTNSSVMATPAAGAAASTNSSVMATPAAGAAATAASTNSSINPEQPIRGRTISTIGSNWSPQDDGIEIRPLPSSTTGQPPSREEVDAHIEAVLYGPKIKERPKCFPKLLPD